MPSLTSYNPFYFNYSNKIICKWESNETAFNNSYDEAINSCSKLNYSEGLWSFDYISNYAITDQDTIKYYINSSSFGRYEINILNL